MPYLAFDLDAKKRVPQVARAAGVQPCEVGWGLLDLWEHVWSSKNDSVGEMLLDGFFGPNQRIREALVAFGFLESKGDGSYRVRGADRYSRISGVRSEGGKTRITTAKRDSKGRLVAADKAPADIQLDSSSRPAEPPAAPAQAGRQLDVPPAQAGELTSSPPAADQLYTEHRTPNVLSSPDKRPSGPADKPKRERPPRASQDFVAWAEARRLASLGPLIPACDPLQTHQWVLLATLLREHGEKVSHLAWEHFERDHGARNRGLPLGLFLAQQGQWVGKAMTGALTSTQSTPSRRLA